MSQLEPTYLRYIYDGLIKGSIHPENAAELPEGLIGLYEEAFDERTSVVERQKLLQRFSIWALLKKEVSAGFVAEVLGETEDEIQDFISKYSAWFNSPESGKYQLYHERLKVFLLQKLSEKKILKLQEELIARLEQAIKEQKKDEFEYYSLEFLGYHLNIQFQISENKSTICKIKNLADNGFIARQIFISGRFNWTYHFFYEALNSLELCDDKLKYSYYYKLFKYYLEEKSRTEDILYHIDLYETQIIIEYIENLDSETLYEKQVKFTIYFNCLLTLLQFDIIDLEKLNALNSKLEECLIMLCEENDDQDLSFFPIPLMFLLGAKLNTLEISSGYLFDKLEIYKYKSGIINNFDETLMLEKLKLLPNQYFIFIEELIQNIEQTYDSFGKTIDKYDSNSDYNPLLQKMHKIYWDLKIKRLESIKPKSFEIQDLDEFLKLTNWMQPEEIENYILLLPQDLELRISQELYNLLEKKDFFKACYLAVGHFNFLDNQNLKNTADLIIHDGIFSPNATWFLLHQKQQIDKSSIDLHFDNYSQFIAINKFDYLIMDNLFSNYFHLVSYKRTDLIFIINEVLFSSINEISQKEMPYSDKLYLLRLFEFKGFLKEIAFNQIIDLKDFELSYLGSEEIEQIKNKILEQNLEELRELFLEEQDNYSDPQDYYSSWELAICEIAIKLGFMDLLIQLIPKIYFENRYDLMNEIWNNRNVFELDFIKKCDVAFYLDEKKYGLDIDISSEILKLKLLIKTFKLSIEKSLEPIHLFEKVEIKTEISNFRQEKYIFNLGKVYLEKQEIQMAINLLPHLMNYKIPSLGFEIGLTNLIMNRNWKEFNSISKELLEFYEDKHEQTYYNFGLNFLSRSSEIENIIGIAVETKIDKKTIVKTLSIYFNFFDEQGVISFFEIIKFKSIKTEFLVQIVIEIITSRQFNRHPIDQLYLFTCLYENNKTVNEVSTIVKNQNLFLITDKINIRGLLRLYNKVDLIEEFYPTVTENFLVPIATKNENILECLLLLGLLPENQIVSEIIKDLLMLLPEIQLDNERNCQSLSLFLQSKSIIQHSEILEKIKDFAAKKRFSIYSFWDEDENTYVEWAIPGVIQGKPIMILNETFQFTSKNYTEEGIWSSNNEKVALVDQKGVVTAIGIGKAKISLSITGIYSGIINSSTLTIEVTEYPDNESPTDKLISNELLKQTDQIKFSPILFRTMKDRKKFKSILEQHAVYKTYFPDDYIGYNELANELFDLTWMNDNPTEN